MAQRVLAKFALIECHEDRFANSHLQDGQWVQEQALGARVKFMAVQGEPFGSATPQGSIEMLIWNPTAAAVFGDAWHRYTRSEENSPARPEFYVTFAATEDSFDDNAEEAAAPRA